MFGARVAWKCLDGAGRSRTATSYSACVMAICDSFVAVLIMFMAYMSKIIHVEESSLPCNFNSDNKAKYYVLVFIACLKNKRAFGERTFISRRIWSGSGLRMTSRS